MRQRLSVSFMARAGFGALIAMAVAFGLLAGSERFNASAQGPGPANPYMSMTLVDTSPGVHIVGQPFVVENNAAVLRTPLPGTGTWGGYNLQIAYGPILTVLNPSNDPAAWGGLCSPIASWGLAQTTPFIQGGCAFQTNTTGSPPPMENFTFQCLEPGTTAIFYVDLITDPAGGSTFFDENAVFIDTGLNNIFVTCALDLEKDDGIPGTGTYNAGQTVTWTIHVSNPTAVSIPGDPITDTVPAPLTNVQVVSSTNGPIDGCSVVGNDVTCATPVIQPDPVGFDLVISADIPLSAAGQTNICNTASQDNGDSDTDCIDVAPASVSVTKTADQPNYQAGDPISWTITVTSGGPSPAANVVVTDAPTDGWTISGISQVSGPSCTLTQPDTADCGTLAANDVVVLNVTGTVNDPNPADNTCNNSVTVTTSNDGQASASAAATCLSKNVRMIKDIDGDQNTDDSLQNLWICLGPTCTNNGEGFLDIQELVLNVGGDADGVGAFEFQLKFDHKVFDITITETNWLYSTGRVPGAPGIGGCAVSIVTENDIRFGCVSKDPDGQEPITPGPTTDGAAAIIHVTPEADLVSRTTPGQDNGIVSTLLNENCELADVFGDPLGTGSYDALGREILLPGILPGGLVEDCADITITVRMLEGDLDLDCDVDVNDDQKIAFRYGSSFGNLLYDKFFDLEPALKDFDIDIKDVQKVFGRNGSTCQAPIPSNQTPQPPPPAGPDPGPNP